MNRETHRTALQVLKTVLLGRTIAGMYFSTSVLWFDDPVKPGLGTAYLRIENSWALIGHKLKEKEIPSSLESDYRALASKMVKLTESKVISVQLDNSEAAHLWINFETGETLFLNGENNRYESWELSCKPHLVVALPGGNLAVCDN